MLRQLALLGLAVAGSVLPVFRLPPPDGGFAVGTILLPHTQIWYPAAPGSRGRRAGYGPAAGGPSRRLMYRVRTGAIIGAPAAPGPFPVVVYINGWGGTRWENSGLLQTLASHGYVAAAADQPDGIVDGVSLATPMDTSDPAAWARTERIAATKLAVQVAAARRLLDQLTAMSAEVGGTLAGRLRLDQAAALGFSFGGATASEMAVADPRIRAAINMDGLLFGTARDRGVRVPYLEFSDATPVGKDAPGAGVAERTLSAIQLADDRQTRVNLARNGGLLLTIAGTQHTNFSDDPGLLPWRRLTGAGPIDPRLASRIIAQWSVGFLDHVFRGGVLPDPAASSAIRLERWPR